MRMRSRVVSGNKSRESTWEMIRASLWSTDYLALGMLIIYTVLDIIFIRQVKSSFAVLQINIFTMVGILAVTMWYDQTGARIAHIFRSFYILPVGYMMYSQVHNYIPLINPHTYDVTLAAWDRAIFGGNPSQWVDQFANPFFTEYFQIWYNFFQLMLIVPAISFYANNRMREFRIYSLMLLFGFYVSYGLYFIMPAIGPRFQLYDFYSIDKELPGLVLTQPFRDFINAGNNITPEMKNPYDVVNRDCMPSGHTMLSMLGILMAWRFRSRTRWRWFITIGGISVIISTIYLRYHYAVDVMVGLALAVILFFLQPLLVKMWQKWGIEV